MTTDDRNFFNSIAGEWDSREVYSTPTKINRLLDVCEITEGMRILDLGTGTGVLIPYLLERIGYTGQILAVDGAEMMLKEALNKFGALTDYDMFLLCDFEKENITGRYDRIFLYCVYPHLTHPIPTIRKLIEQNLDDNGKIVIAFPVKEDVINNIHREKKAPGTLLPPSHVLAEKLTENGIAAKSVSIDDAYLVCISK